MEPMAIEEMTAINRKRERDDKIGKLMGEYLLQGYKMLGSTCSICGTILLRDKKQQDYCIGCNEVDVAPTAFQTTATEGTQLIDSWNIRTHSTNNHDEIELKSQGEEIVDKTPVGPLNPPNESCDPHAKRRFDRVAVKLQERITWAASQLGTSNSVEMDIKLSELICSCGKALKVLNNLQN